MMKHIHTNITSPLITTRLLVLMFNQQILIIFATVMIAATKVSESQLHDPSVTQASKFSKSPVPAESTESPELLVEVSLLVAPGLVPWFQWFHIQQFQVQRFQFQWFQRSLVQWVHFQLFL